MPVMDGVEAYKLIKQVNPTIPVIAVTANAMAHDIEHYAAIRRRSHVDETKLLSCQIGHFACKLDTLRG